MEFNPNLTYMLYSATAKDSVYHKDKTGHIKKNKKPRGSQIVSNNGCANTG
jgi:hypothetical protein